MSLNPTNDLPTFQNEGQPQLPASGNKGPPSVVWIWRKWLYLLEFLIILTVPHSFSGSCVAGLFYVNDYGACLHYSVDQAGASMISLCLIPVVIGIVSTLAGLKYVSRGLPVPRNIERLAKLAALISVAFGVIFFLILMPALQYNAGPISGEFLLPIGICLVIISLKRPPVITPAKIATEMDAVKKNKSIPPEQIASDPQLWYDGGKTLPPGEQLNYFEAGLEKDPTFHPWVWCGIGFYWLQLKDYYTAAASYERALKLDPKMIYAWKYLSLVNQAIGDAKGAEAAAQRARELDPSGKIALQNLENVAPQSNATPVPPPVLVSQEKPTGTAQKGTPQFLINNGMGSIFLGFGSFCGNLPFIGGNFSLIIPCFCIVCLPFLIFGVTRIRRGYAYIASGIGRYNLIPGYESSGNPKLQRAKRFNDLGNTWFAKKKFKKARQAYLYAIKLHPKNAEAWYGFGETSLVLSKIETALDAFAQAIKLDPTKGSVWQRLGEALESNDHPNESLYCYQQAATLGSLEVKTKMTSLQMKGAAPQEPSFIKAWQPGTSAKSVKMGS